MKTLVSLLGCIALCLAQPFPPLPDNKNLTDLINNVFPVPPFSTTKSSSSLNNPGSLNVLIENALKNRDITTTQRPILGTDNNRQTNKPTDCVCVTYYQCRNDTIVTDGVDIIDIRASGPCYNYLEVCCKPPNLVNGNDKVITPPTPTRKGCGHRNPNGVGFRITGATNNEAQFGEFPWMVGVLTYEVINENGEKMIIYQCGGSLIHTRAVLTAAHCVNGKKPSELSVRAGEWDTQTRNEIFPHQDRKVEAIVVHEQFNSGALQNDTAILILSEPFELAENVDVVCLPDEGAVFDGSRCFASGWGRNIFGKEGNYQVILKKVDVPIVPHDTCQNSLRRTRLGNYFVLDRTFICAGGEEGKDTCKGDGGSPLVCPLKEDPSRYVQAGIVAWGIGCGEDGTPGVYVNVAEFRHWIDEQIIYYNLDNNSYKYKP